MNDKLPIRTDLNEYNCDSPLAMISSEQIWDVFLECRWQLVGACRGHIFVPRFLQKGDDDMLVSSPRPALWFVASRMKRNKRNMVLPWYLPRQKASCWWTAKLSCGMLSPARRWKDWRYYQKTFTPFSILQMQRKAPKARLKALFLISNHHQRLPL